MAATQTAEEDLQIRGDSLTWFATADVEYGFCGECGSTLFWRSPRVPRQISIAAGTLTPPTGLKAIAAIYTDYASDYHAFEESIPSFPEDRPNT